MLSTHTALARILALALPVATETIALRRGLGRVLAETLIAERPQPPFRASAMDGYALREADLALGAPLQVIATAQAGAGFVGSLQPGQALRIFTGAPVPDGADRVVIQEDVAVQGDRITVSATADAARHVRPAGSDFAAGFAVTAPMLLGPAQLGLIAAMGKGTITVRRRPVVAVIATGDELVQPGDVPGPDQIWSSNGTAIAALLEKHGAAPRLLPIAVDSAASLNAVLDLAADADLIVTLGGASVGERDLVRDVAQARGMALDFWKVAMRPGKPLLAGRLGTVPLIGLPGNPVSAMVCGHLFLRPMLDAMLGLPTGPLTRLPGILACDMPANGNREHYQRGTATATAAGYRLDLAANQDSAMMSLLAGANALIIAAPNQPARAAGAMAEFIPI